MVLNEVELRSRVQLFDKYLRGTLSCRPFALTHYYYYCLTEPFNAKEPFLRDISSKTAVDIVIALTNLDRQRSKRPLLKASPTDVKRMMSEAYKKALSEAKPGTVPKAKVSAAMTRKFKAMYKGKPEGFQDAVDRMVYRYQTLNSVARDTMQLSLSMEHYKKGEFEYECFGSPINCHLSTDKSVKHLFSAFPDTDTVFGSLGSFFQNYNKIKAGSRCSIDPPYQITAMDKAVDIMEELIKTKHIHGTIVVPAWLDAYYAKKLKKYPTYKVIGKGTMEYEVHSIDKPLKTMGEVCDTIIVTF